MISVERMLVQDVMSYMIFVFMLVFVIPWVFSMPEAAGDVEPLHWASAYLMCVGMLSLISYDIYKRLKHIVYNAYWKHVFRNV